jgi:hypothetical protein
MGLMPVETRLIIVKDVMSGKLKPVFLDGCAQ